MTKRPFSRVGDRSWRPKSRAPASASVPSPLCYAGGGRPLSFGLDFVRPFSRSADLERARLCPRLIKWFLRPSGSKRPFGVERDMLFILSGFLFYGVREKRRAACRAPWRAGVALLRRANRIGQAACSCACPPASVSPVQSVTVTLATSILFLPTMRLKV